MAIHLSRRESEVLGLRFTILRYVALGLLAFLLIRFWTLQVIQYNKWLYVAQENQIRHINMPASRGLIGDRYGRIIARDRISFNINLIPADVDDETIRRLAKYIELAEQTIRDRLIKGQRWSPFIAVPVARDITRDQFARVAEHLHSLSGVVDEVATMREYPKGELFAHVVGYLGEINSDELNRPEFQDYKLGEYVGREATEKLYESMLRGIDGRDVKLVDARGREQPETRDEDLGRELKKHKKQAIPGRQIDLTLDSDLQEALAKQFAGKTGAAVILDVNTGEVLAMVNSPSFDPEQLLGGMDPENWEMLLDEKGRPLFNRAIQGTYPPGSLFKIVTAAAALEEDNALQDEEIRCPGYYMLGGHRFNCWRRRGHGKLEIQKAIVQSCDVYFYIMGERLGINRIAKMARDFGLGETSGLGLLGEKAGLIPTTQWKEKIKKEKWYSGETLPCAIGQGFVLVTPLQAALIPMAVATGGRVMKPQFVLRIQDEGGDMRTVFQPEVLHDNIFSKETAEILKKAMVGVVNEKKGTAYWTAHSDMVLIAGKTGTSQVSERYTDADEEDVPEKYRDHAWFAAYAPADRPEIAISVLVEHGGHGSSAAAPIAKKVIEDYMKLRHLIDSN